MNQMGKEEKTAVKQKCWKENCFPFNRKLVFTAVKSISHNKEAAIVPPDDTGCFNVKKNACKDTRSSTCRNYISDKSTILEKLWIFTHLLKA